MRFNDVQHGLTELFVLVPHYAIGKIISFGHTRIRNKYSNCIFKILKPLKTCFAPVITTKAGQESKHHSFKHAYF